ncbi:MAG: polyphenol oxidase family protein [Clostridiales bacterium]|nr:polyphenol oxidase family protein [Clostridiales bacterium]
MDLLRKDNVNILKIENHILTDGTALPLLTFPLLEDSGIVRHGFTTRLGGVSEGVFASMNLSFTRGDDPDHVMENYRRLAGAMGVDLERIVCSDQTHTTNVRVVTEADAGKGVVRPRDYTDVDGLITNVPGLTLATFFADCVPLYFVDPVHRAIGLSHSGWRGTVGRMGEKTLEAMAENYGTRPEEALCAIGPSICQDCYEVSADVALVFAQEFVGHEAELLKHGKIAGHEAETERLQEFAGHEAETERLQEFAGYEAETEKLQEFAGHKTETQNNASATTALSADAIQQAPKDRKYQLDLWKANEIVLLEAGVLREHLSVTDICTCCNPDLLFSHRASHGKRGNLGAFLSLRERC